MRGRPIYFNDLAAFLVELRERAGWNQRQAAHIAGRRGLTTVTRQVLLRMERGQIKAPDADVLRGLAALYNVPYEEMAGRLLRERYGVSVVCKSEQTVAEMEVQNRTLPADSVQAEPASPSTLDPTGDAHVATPPDTHAEILDLLIETATTLAQMSERLRPFSGGQDSPSRDGAPSGAQSDRAARGRHAGQAGRSRRRRTA